MSATIENVTKLRSKVEWKASLHDWHANHKLRERHISEVGFPILTIEVLEILVETLKGYRVVDVGCGTGYLSKQLQDRGVNVVPVDACNTSYSLHKQGSRFTDITVTDALTMDLTVFDAVILSWPCYNEPFAFNVVEKMYPGQILVYQGEGWGGCTGDDNFHRVLDSKFEEIEELDERLWKAHAQFDGIHDSWHVYVKD